MYASEALQNVFYQVVPGTNSTHSGLKGTGYVSDVK